MRTWKEIGIWGLVVGASLGLHAVAFGGLGGLGGVERAPARRSTLVEMSIAPSRAPAPLPDTPAEQPAPARRVALARPSRAAARRPRPSSPPPPSASAAPPPEAETLADFTGVTLTNTVAGAAGWSSATGNGQAMRGAIGRPGARVTGRNVDGDPDSTSHAPGPPVVGEADLSRRPVAPDLTSALARAYPDEARRKALAGRAVIRALVLPDGHLTRISTQLESAPGFGAACARTLRESRWSPPLDRSARAVSTFISYTCRFEVQ
jgi:outer membrane biosynthesis protein TonB